MPAHRAPPKMKQAKAQTSMPAHRAPPKMKQAKAQGIDFALDLVYRIISGKDRLNFGPVARRAN